MKKKLFSLLTALVLCLLCACLLYTSAGSSGVQPHWLHLAGAGAGLGLPQLQQNLPVLEVPQLHTQLPAAGAGAGLGLPQFAQNLPVLPVWPQPVSYTHLTPTPTPPKLSATTPSRTTAVPAGRVPTATVLAAARAENSKAIPHNSKCRYGERGAVAAKPKAQIILCVLSSILATQMPCRSRRSGA